MDLVDFSEPCRCCGGKKTVTEIDYRDGRRVMITGPCYDCRGTGRRTILLIEIPVGRAA